MTAPRPRFVIVLGPYRSGTSITARVIASLGVDFGRPEKLIPANLQNPSGYFERDDTNAANTRFIASAGGTLETPGAPADLLRAGDKTILRNHSFAWVRPGSAAGIKDPRMCATLASWMEAGVFSAADCRLIHVTRPVEETLESALRHPTVSAYAGGDRDRLRKMLLAYADHARWHVQTLPVPSLTVPYERLTRHPLRATREIAAFLGVRNPLRIFIASRFVGKNNARVVLFATRALRAVRFQLGRLRHALHSGPSRRSAPHP